MIWRQRCSSFYLAAVLRAAAVAILMVCLWAASACAADCPPYVAIAAPDVACYVVPFAKAQLFAYRAPAREPAKAGEPILVLTGGPDMRIAPVISELLATPTLSKLRETHDLIFMEGRGNWPSRPVMACPTLMTWRAPEPMDVSGVAICAWIDTYSRWETETLGPAGAARRFGPRAGLWSDITLLTACPVLSLAPATDLPDRISGNLPTLILLGRYDANVPEAPALALAAAQPDHVRAVTMAATGHAVDNNCAAKLAAAFFADPRALLDARCAQEPISFE